MPAALTTDQVTAAAADAASLQAGRGLASPRQWQSTGSDADALWGLVQGSGKEPYQVQVALPELASRCSCPSRKLPCKHALGLMWLAAEQGTALGQGPRPDWVAEWLAERAERAARAETRAARPERPVDEVKRGKRAAARQGRVEEGIALLQQWLEDRLRSGLAEARLDEPKAWDELARRMVDAQAPGLARRVLWLAAAARGRDEAALLDGLGRLQLLIEAWTGRAGLTDALRAEVERAVGTVVPQEELRGRPGVRDRWFVAARTESHEEQLVVTTTWLLGHATRRWAELLEFTPLAAGRRAGLALGTSFEGELAFYPGALPLRALPPEPLPPPSDGEPPQPAAGWSPFLAEYAAGLATSPWRTHAPFLLLVQPGRAGERDVLVDAEGLALPWRLPLSGPIELLALCGGAPIPVCGTWDGSAARALSAASEGRWIALGGGSP